jgi:signal transduction histidine kinase
VDEGAGNLKRTLSVTLVLTASLLLVATAWSFVALTRALSLQSASVRGQVLLAGRELDRSLAARGYQAPDGTEVLRPSRDPDTLIFLRQVALRGGAGNQWAVPLAEPTRARLPLLGAGEQVGATGDGWFYARRLTDGRLLVAFYEAPAFERMKDGFLLLAAYEAGSVFTLLLFWALLAWKFHRAYTGIAGSLREAGTLLSQPPSLFSPQGLPITIHQTVAALKKRTEELENQTRKEKRRKEEVEDLAKALCTNLQTGYLRFDAEGRLLEGNLEARRLMGMVEFPRQGDRTDVLLDGHATLLELLDEVRATREIGTREEVRGAAGILLQAAAIPLSNQMGQLKGHLLVLRDRTEAYAMARTLREREALSRLGEVSAGVAHEVRNALGSMIATLRLLREDHSDLGGDPRFQMLGEEIRGVEKMVRDLLFFARPLPLEVEELVALELLEELAEQIREGFPGVEVEVRAGGATLRADRETLVRALVNLARNASEAALAGDRCPPRVRFEAIGRPGEGVTIRVEDSGGGLPADSSRLFEPFFSQKPGGTGLGLAIARKVAREHGGDLISSRDPSPLGGATFKLTLP